MFTANPLLRKLRWTFVLYSLAIPTAIALAGLVVPLFTTYADTAIMAAFALYPVFLLRQKDTAPFGVMLLYAGGLGVAGVLFSRSVLLDLPYLFATSFFVAVAAITYALRHWVDLLVLPLLVMVAHIIALCGLIFAAMSLVA